MKTKYLVLSGALLLAASSLSFAQDSGQPGGNQDGKHRPRPNPLLHIFDTNHDGVISADEIADAPAALKALDKNGDGQLTADELRPPRGPKGEKGGQSGNDDMPPPPPEEAP
ncbi:MAG TPA: EF-hand domain-containing protein [Rariglobus sp.]|jgi:hypothetical protein|nr:EF-hand domain-containing protein [Rariglobus sp.]